MTYELKTRKIESPKKSLLEITENDLQSYGHKYSVNNIKSFSHYNEKTGNYDSYSKEAFIEFAQKVFFDFNERKRFLCLLDRYRLSNAVSSLWVLLMDDGTEFVSYSDTKTLWSMVPTPAKGKEVKNEVPVSDFFSIGKDEYRRNGVIIKDN